jgi:hypothetical protein
MQTKTMIIRDIPEELKRQIKELAAREGMSLQALMIKIMEDYTILHYEDIYR